MKSEARIKAERIMRLSTEAIILDIRLTKMWMYGERSEKMKRILKKSTKRIERRNEKWKLALDAMM